MPRSSAPPTFCARNCSSPSTERRWACGSPASRRSPATPTPRRSGPSRRSCSWSPLDVPSASNRGCSPVRSSPRPARPGWLPGRISPSVSRSEPSPPPGLRSPHPFDGVRRSWPPVRPASVSRSSSKLARSPPCSPGRMPTSRSRTRLPWASSSSVRRRPPGSPSRHRTPVVTASPCPLSVSRWPPPSCPVWRGGAPRARRGG